jgi:hypothetical protein
MRLQDPARPTRASKGPKPGPDSRRHQQRTRVRGRKLGPVSLECCLGHDGGCAGRQGGEEQDDAHEPADGVVCAVSGTPDRRADECRDRGQASAETSRAGPSRPDVGPPSRAIQVPRAVWRGRRCGPTTSAPQSRVPSSSPCTPWPSKHRRTPPRTPRHPPPGPAKSADRSRSSTHASRRDGRSSRRPGRARRVQRGRQRDLGSTAAGARHRVLRNAARLGRQSHGCPRSVGPRRTPQSNTITDPGLASTRRQY